MKDKKFVFFLTISSVLIIINSFIIFKHIQKINKMEQSVPILMPGEKIDYFSLVGEKGRKVSDSVLKNRKPLVIFIFSRPCSPCDDNIVFWKKMTTILKNDARVFGIVLSNNIEASELVEKAKLNFDVYIPENEGLFVEKFKLKSNYSETIIIYNEQVKYSFMGKLESKEIIDIIKFVRSIH